MRKYRNTLPKYVIDNLNWIIFKAQIEIAQKEGLIGDMVDVIVDNSDRWYYEGDRYPDNPYITKGAPSKYYKQTQDIWLILTNRQARRLREIRKDFLDGTTTLKEAMKKIMVMTTTNTPPKNKKARQGWAHHICNVYDHRWQIETGFRDLNRISPSSNARTNERKFLMISVRYWVYNCWQIERARRKKLR